VQVVEEPVAEWAADAVAAVEGIVGTMAVGEVLVAPAGSATESEEPDIPAESIPMKSMRLRMPVLAFCGPESS
jgi:hypothetical protein